MKVYFAKIGGLMMMRDKKNVDDVLLKNVDKLSNDGEQLDLWKFNKKREKEYRKSTKLDFKTWLYLFITNAIRVWHIPVIMVEDKLTMSIKEIKKNEVYVFKDYEEYRNFFLMYLDSVDEDLISLAIYTKGDQG